LEARAAFLDQSGRVDDAVEADCALDEGREGNSNRLAMSEVDVSNHCVIWCARFEII